MNAQDYRLVQEEEITEKEKEEKKEGKWTFRRWGCHIDIESRWSREKTGLV